MDLNKIKQLEDLKVKHAEYQKQKDKAYKPYYDKYFTKKKEFISSINDTFRKYFASNGFTVSNDKDWIIAKYNTFEVSLKPPLPEEQSIGIYSVFDLRYNNNTNKLFAIREGEVYKSGTRFNENDPVLDKTQEEINKLQNEIDNIKENIDKVDVLIKELESIKIYFEFIDKTNAKLSRKKKFTTFEEILNIIFSQA